MLDAATLERIRREMGAGEGAPATVLGSAPQQRIVSTARRAMQVDVSEAARGAVVDVLAARKPRIQAHFERRLDGFEEPQFLRYGPGDHFVAHQDGNTPLLHDESRFRRVSVVVFLSAPAAFRGGALVLYDRSEPPL